MGGSSWPAPSTHLLGQAAQLSERSWEAEGLPPTVPGQGVGGGPTSSSPPQPTDHPDHWLILAPEGHQPWEACGPHPQCPHPCMSSPPRPPPLRASPPPGVSFLCIPSFTPGAPYPRTLSSPVPAPAGAPTPAPLLPAPPPPPARREGASPPRCAPTAAFVPGLPPPAAGPRASRPSPRVPARPRRPPPGCPAYLE